MHDVGKISKYKQSAKLSKGPYTREQIVLHHPLSYEILRADNQAVTIESTKVKKYIETKIIGRVSNTAEEPVWKWKPRKPSFGRNVTPMMRLNRCATTSKLRYLPSCARCACMWHGLVSRKTAISKVRQWRL